MDESRVITAAARADVDEVAAAMEGLSSVDKASVMGYINGIKDASHINTAAAEKKTA